MDPNLELDGAVVHLEREEGQPTGKATILGIVEGLPKRITADAVLCLKRSE
jgi:hypothetical protein